MDELLLNQAGRSFRDQLQAVRLHHEAVRAHIDKAPKLQVAGVGQTIASTYEQIRNAAENTEEHLLLQRAIRRFFIRNLSFHIQKAPEGIGEELIVELTQASYLSNGAIALATVEAIEQAIRIRHQDFWRLREIGISHTIAEEWVLDVLSVEVEEFLGDDHLAQNTFVHFAHGHFRMLFEDEITPGQEELFDFALYVAIHQSLLRSDTATIRREVTRLYLRHDYTAEALAEMNKRIDAVCEAELTKKLARGVVKHGAPMRILREMVMDSEATDLLLSDRTKFIAAYETQLQEMYDDIAKRLNRGIIKSIIFLIVTKVLIGLAIEIPYDIVFHGYIAWLPLAINILFPPLYMASLKWSLRLPGVANRQATVNAMEQILYVDESTRDKTVKLKNKKVSTIMSLVYAMMFVVSFSVVVLALALLEFNVVQGIIFFVFLSTASFLGFRLSRTVRELEMFAPYQNFLDAIRDFFYTPFVMVGRWISDKYSKVNVITLILDMAIELPLKTILRMIRQWMRFLNEKRDEM